MSDLNKSDFSKFYKTNNPDLSWIEKPGRHQIRWRLVDNNWITASRRFRGSAKNAGLHQTRNHGGKFLIQEKMLTITLLVGIQ